MSTWTEADHARLATLFDGVETTHDFPGRFSDLNRCGVCGVWQARPHPKMCLAPYPGYKPAVREAPNGDTKACPECTCDTPGCVNTGRGAHPLCPRCLGTANRYARKIDIDGAGPASAVVTGPALRVPQCSTCNGSGRVPNVDAEGDCPTCRVKGFYGPNHPCPTCAGSGRAPAKRYLHVAPKYHPPPWAADYYDRAFAEACRVATALGVPAAYRPHEAYCALRVLEYPPGAGTVEHTDSDLFTIVLWRSTPEDLEIPRKTVPVPTQGHVERYCAAIAMSPGMHIGKIGELVGLGPATPHRVPARPYAQKSIVFFAIPDHAAVIHKPWGPVADEVTVGEWLDRELAKMRYEAT